jgi:phosphoglycerate dehydrogenase-like enzyme
LRTPIAERMMAAIKVGHATYLMGTPAAVEPAREIIKMENAKLNKSAILIYVSRGTLIEYTRCYSTLGALPIANPNRPRG